LLQDVHRSTDGAVNLRTDQREDLIFIIEWIFFVGSKISTTKRDTTMLTK